MRISDPIRLTELTRTLFSEMSGTNRINLQVLLKDVNHVSEGTSIKTTRTKQQMLEAGEMGTTTCPPPPHLSARPVGCQYGAEPSCDPLNPSVRDS